MFKRVLLIFFCLLLVALPVYAQETEPTTVPDATHAESAAEETASEEVHEADLVAEPAAEEPVEEETTAGLGLLFILVGMSAVLILGYLYSVRSRNN